MVLETKKKVKMGPKSKEKKNGGFFRFQGPTTYPPREPTFYLTVSEPKIGLKMSPNGVKSAILKITPSGAYFTPKNGKNRFQNVPDSLFSYSTSDL